MTDNQVSEPRGTPTVRWAPRYGKAQERDERQAQRLGLP
jgi:hypothetical protein